MAWRLQSMGFLLISLTLLESICATEKGEECSYLLEVKTSCSIFDSGTDDPVLVRFVDKSFYDKNKVEVLERHLSQSMNEGNAKPFSWCKTDKFNLTGSCVNDQLCYVYFKVEGKDNWRVGDAVIHHGDDEDTFHFNKKLPENTWDGIEFCNKNLKMIASFADKGNAIEHRKVKRKRTG